ncbi:hypothetical protein BJV78DRAFT_807863 [Lactifluus subvellereus]|nr:hypothetical protein BJV78DRAFT_807863 [Lactifluus subvellereus]
MLRFFSSDHRRSSASAPTDCSSLSKEIVPGGPSPDSPFEAPALGAADAGAHSQTTGRTFGNVGGSTESEPGVDIVPTLQPSQHLVPAGIHAPQGASQSELCPATSAPDPKPIFKKVGKDSPSRPRGRLLDAHLENTPTATAGEGADAPRSASVASCRTNRSVATNNVSGSAFANGAATASNEPPDVDPSLQARAASAEDELRPREKAAISKEEHGVGRKLSKIIKSEAKAEEAALHVALKELAEIQKLQKASIKEEAKSHSRHSRALSDAHKAEMELLVARTANEREQANLRATGEVLEASRKHARETTEMLRGKMEEVERLRMYKQVDDRERTVKVKGLVGEERNRLVRTLGSA